MKRVFTTILVFLGLLTVGATIEINAAVTSKSFDITISNFTEITTSYTTKFTHTYSVSDFEEQNVDIPVEAYGVYKNAQGIQMNKGKGTYIKNTVALPGAITNVSMTWTASGKNSPTLYFAKDAMATTSSKKVTNASTTKDHSIDLAVEDGYNYFYFDGTTVTGACYLTNLTITYSMVDTSATYYDITFDAQNGTEPKVFQVKENEKISEPATPEKDGFIFKGWYKESTCENLFDFEVEVATEAMTLYAGWDIDPYNYASITTDNFNPVTGGTSYASYNGSHILMNEDNTKNEFSYTTYQVMVQSDMIQFQKAAGYLYNGSTVKGNISSIKLDNLIGEVEIYTSDSVIENVTDLTGTTLTADNSVYTVPDGVEHTFFYIKVSGTALAKASAITVQYTYDESFARYSVRFNAGKGVFKEGKGVTLSELEGVALTGNLPTVADLEMTAYKYTNLVGWNDGTKTYAPGEAFEVSNLTVFNAVYEVPENITVDQANEIAALAGTTKTSYKFSCMGIVSSVEKLNEKSIQFTLKDLTSETTISVYNSKLNGPLFEGDKITVTGSLCNFNNTTIQFMDDSSYVINDNLISSFTHTETKSSLKALYDSNFMPVDVDFRFGAKISLNSYNETATYGVMAIDNATFARFVAGKTEYATADEFIAAHAGVKKMACPNGALLEDGYQFAWVMTDMEGHYKTYLTAVIYMEYDGVLYLGVSKIKSVAQQASRYIEDQKNPENTEVILTEEQLKVLQNIISKEA